MPENVKNCLECIALLGVVSILIVVALIIFPVDGNQYQDTAMSKIEPKIGEFILIRDIANVDPSLYANKKGVWVCPICEDGVVLYITRTSYGAEAGVGMYGTRDCSVLGKYCPGYKGTCSPY